MERLAVAQCSPPSAAEVEQLRRAGGQGLEARAQVGGAEAGRADPPRTAGGPGEARLRSGEALSVGAGGALHSRLKAGLGLGGMGQGW